MCIPWRNHRKNWQLLSKGVILILRENGSGAGNVCTLAGVCLRHYHTEGSLMPKVGLISGKKITGTEISARSKGKHFKQSKVERRIL